MYKYYTYLRVRPVKGNRWEIVDNYSKLGTFIPKGFITNGADVPRIFWSFFPPNRSDYFPAVVVHDFMCRDAVDYYELLEADRELDTNLKRLQVGKVTRFCMVNACKMWHYFRYKLFKFL